MLAPALKVCHNIFRWLGTIFVAEARGTCQNKTFLWPMHRHKSLLYSLSKISPFNRPLYRTSTIVKMSSNSSESPSSSGPGSSSLSSDLKPLASMIDEGISPKELLSHLAPCLRVPAGADDMMLWRLLVSMIEPPKRKKLPQYNTIEDAIELIKKSQKIVVLSGAGISTSAGLPDFRSRNGIYVQIHAEHPDLHDPKSMFDIEYFRKNPLPFYRFAKALYPGQFKPTIGHQFVKCIEDHGKLLRNYSQNIDTLEKQAGIKSVVECHGSFAEATCTSCKYCVDGDEIKNDVFAQKIPLCPKCKIEGPRDGLGVMKPNIVFFGEQLGEEFHKSFEADKEQADLLIVIGSSLKVRPVALIPRSVPANVPQILINREPLDNMGFDIELLGDCDEIIQEMCLRLGDSWTKICKPDTKPLTELKGSTHLDLASNSPLRKDSSIPKDDTRSKNEESGEKTATTTANESNDNLDNVSMDSVHDNALNESSSFKSTQADIASDSTEPNVIDDESRIQAESAIEECDKGSDDDWEDVEVLSSSTASSEQYLLEKLDLKVPDSSFVHLPPCMYIFAGAGTNQNSI